MADLNHAPKGMPVPPGKLELTGITSKTVPIKKGGLSIKDGTTDLRIASDRAIFFVSFEREEIRHLAEMELPHRARTTGSADSGDKQPYRCQAH
ncbi:hypothetical protein FOXYSP1_15966 [Fusarium oxysporum f. sp. phaseoli]